MRISNLALAILMAFSLCWILFAQDQTAVFETDPTSDLPEMMTSAAIELKSQLVAPVAPVAPVLPAPSIAPAQIAPRSIVSDDFSRASTAPLVWRLNNPSTAPPAA